MVTDCDDEAIFPSKLLLANTPFSRIRKSFANVSSANIKLSTSQLFKMEQSAGFILDLTDPVEMMQEPTGSLESFGKEICFQKKKRQ